MADQELEDLPADPPREQAEDHVETLIENQELIKQEKEELQELEQPPNLVDRKKCEKAGCPKKANFLVEEDGGKQVAVYCEGHVSAGSPKHALKDVSSKLKELSISPTLQSLAEQSAGYLELVQERMAAVVEREILAYKERLLTHQKNFSEVLSKEDVGAIKGFRQSPQAFDNRRILEIYKKGLKAKERRDEKGLQILKILFKERSTNIDSLINSLSHVQLFMQVCLSDVLNEQLDDYEEKSESRLLSSQQNNSISLWEKPSYLSDLEIALEKHSNLAEVSVLKLNLDRVTSDYWSGQTYPKVFDRLGPLLKRLSNLKILVLKISDENFHKEGKEDILAKALMPLKLEQATLMNAKPVMKDGSKFTAKMAKLKQAAKFKVELLSEQ